MTNQYDDEQYDDEISSAGVRRFLPNMVMLFAVLGFSILSWYAYNSGTPVKEEDLLVVEAEKTPMKEKPADPGGMQFPNQDKTIFETFSNSPQEDAKVERVLPAPEEPIKQIEKPIDGSETKAFIEEKKAQYSQDDSSGIVSNEEKPIDVKKSEVVAVEEKKIIKTVEAKSVEKPVKPVIKTLSKITNIQLGAYPSDAEARKDWAKIQKKFVILAGKAPIVVKATVNGKDFYRLRVATDNASKICAELSAKGQACIIPKK